MTSTKARAIGGTATDTTSTPAGLLEEARRGDERAFQELVTPYLGELRAHGYRMLGSIHDAEEAVQDGLLRAWKGLPGFEGRSSIRTWLYRIVTNVCLTRIARQPRVLPDAIGPASDPASIEWGAVEARWIEPYPTRLSPVTTSSDPEDRYAVRESVELAFVAALQHLPGSQRAALLLRDVLGFSAKESAAALVTTVAAVNSALQRARASVRRRLPEASQQATLHALGDRRVRHLAQSYVEAWERGDTAAIVAMLAEDATFAMPPRPVWLAGRDDIAAFLPVGPLQVRWHLRRIEASAQLAFGCYAWAVDERTFLPHSIDVLTLRGDRIVQIAAFLEQDADIFARFGLPPRVPSTAPTDAAECT